MNGCTYLESPPELTAEEAVEQAAAAARAVRRGQERYALLGDEVDIETAEQRIERVDHAFLLRQQRSRGSGLG